MSEKTKLFQPPHDDIPYAQVLPLKPDDDTGPMAYPVAFKNYHDDVEALSAPKPSEPVVDVLREATVLENLGWDNETRRLFIRKVYFILTVQLLLTGGVSAFMTLHIPTQMYVLTHGWPVVLSIVLSFAILFAMMYMKDKHPQNFYLLGAFTVVETFMVGTVVTTYCAAGYKSTVLEAVFVTGVIFIGLTLFTFQSKINFSFLGSGLSMVLGAMILWGLFAMIFGVQAGCIYALIGCITFSGYILFDTWLILDRLSPHQYILGAIMLYTDVINLFLYLLLLLVKAKEEGGYFGSISRAFLKIKNIRIRQVINI